MKILAFGASYSQASINKQFATFAAQQFDNATVEVINLNNYPLPLFTVDTEKAIGHPAIIHDFLTKMEAADLLVISLAEHNGSYAAAFKNLFDWVSRVKLKFFEGKKLFLLSTAPGARGGAGVMDAAKVRFPIHGATILATFSLPKFQENFDVAIGITNAELKTAFETALQTVKTAL